MSQPLTYYAALRLLVNKQNPLLSQLERAAAGGVVEHSATLLSLEDLANEVIRTAQEAVRRIPEWSVGVSRVTRTQLLAATQAIVAVSVCLETLAEVAPGPAVLTALRSSPEPAAAGPGDQTLRAYAGIIEFLLHEPVPRPEPHQAYAETRERLSLYYNTLARRLIDAISPPIASRPQLVERALDHYDAAYRQLAGSAGELAAWAGLTAESASRTSLLGVTRLLEGMSIRHPGQRARSVLTLTYQAALAEPVIGSSSAPDGVVIPSLEDAYVDPRGKVAEIKPLDRPSEAGWWREYSPHPDVNAFLAGYLTSPRATTAPLVVLGEPGSGKSKLAEVLAARLPEQDFLPILVPLRDVAAESMIQEQVEQAITHGHGPHLSWHALLEAAENTLPVVILDGLDELIQATSVNRYDYLEQVRSFQARQAHSGRPVAVIVTSRTVVADAIRFPPGTLALQLQPFTDDQVRLWLEIWARHNAALLAGRGLRPLPAAVALTHRQLAEQPLLLLLIALFDAADNSLQRLDSQLGQAELYERLIREFAVREVTKTARNRALPVARQHQLAQREMQRLAVVALAMFARGQQSASETDLDQDLPLLFHEDERADYDSGAALTPAQRATGRFFFLHKSEARVRDEPVRSYEFLHATFGEFLVAQLAVNALRDTAAHLEVIQRGMITAGQLDDGFLYATLSFSCLASRRPIISFMAELFRQLADDERARCRDLLTGLIPESLFTRPNRSFANYEPVRYPVSRRIACYSANLVTMLVLADGTASVAEFSGPDEPGKKWPQYGHLWRSAFSSSEWRSLLDAIRARVSRCDGRVEVTLTLEDGAPVVPLESMLVTEDYGHLHTNYDVRISREYGVSYDVAIPAYNIAGKAFRDYAFLPSWSTAVLLLQTVPYLRTTDGEARHERMDGSAVLTGHLLATLDYSREAPPEERERLYAAFSDALTAPAVKGQLLVRLADDVRDFRTAATLEILAKIEPLPPIPAAIAIVRTLQGRGDPEPGRSSVKDLISQLCASWPADALAQLDE